MPPDTRVQERDLKIAVETIVAPIPADTRLKDQYREELLGHLKDLFETARRGKRDEPEALEEAMERLGEPETLRAQFVESLSQLDRFSGRIAIRLQRRQYESCLAYALRGSAFFAFCIGSFMAILIVPTIAGITLFKGPVPATVVLLSVLGTFAVVYSTATVFIAFLLDTPAERTRNDGCWFYYSGFVGLVFLVSILSGALAGFAGHAVAAAVLGARHEDVFMFDAAAAMTVVGGTISMIVATFAGGIGEGTKLRSRLPEWPFPDNG